MSTMARPYMLPERLPERHIDMAPAVSLSDRCGPPVVALVVVLAASGFIFGFTTALAGLTVLGYALLLVGFARPAPGMLGAGLLCTIDAVSRSYLMTGGLLRFNTFNYLLLLLLLAAFPITATLTDRSSRLMHALLLVLAAGLAVSPDVASGLQVALNAAAVYGLTVCCIRAARDAHVWIWVAHVSSIAAGIGCLVYFFLFADTEYVNANAFAQFPVTALYSICLAFTCSSLSKGHRTMMLILAATNTIWIFLSGSRGNMFVAIICLVFIFTASRSIGQRLFFFVAAILIAAAAFTVFASFTDYALGRIDKLMNTEYSERERTSGRTDIVRAGWYMFTENPLGVGTGGFGSVYSGLRLKDLAFAGINKQAHSAWLKTLAENGIIGIAVFAAYVFSFTTAGVHARRRDIARLGILTTAAMAAAFLSTEFQTKGVWWLAAGATTMLYHREDDDVVEAEI